MPVNKYKIIYPKSDELYSKQKRFLLSSFILLLILQYTIKGKAVAKRQRLPISPLGPPLQKSNVQLLANNLIQ